MRYTTKWLMLAALTTAAVGTTTATGQESPVPAPQPPPTVVDTERIYPKRIFVVRSRFNPDAYPSASGVKEIINHEADRVGASASHLRSRVFCESGFSWRATNGQYVGVGQFAWETFYRGVRSLDTRIVLKKTKRWRAKKVLLVDTMSDGTISKRFGWQIRQRVVHHYKGVIPRHPPHRHTWAQIRIMALAMVGRSGVNDSEWACR